MASRVRTHLRGNVIGYIALFVALGGTAYAAGADSIGSRELSNQSVGSKEIKQSSVKSQDLSDALTSAIQDDEGSCGWVGQILQVGFDWAPEGTAPANGWLLSVAQNQALFELYGTTYGGDGVETFALPKLTTTDGTTKYVVCMTGEYPQRP